MRRHVVTPLLAAAALAVAPAAAQAAVVATWPLTGDARDSSGHGHDGSAQNVIFDGSALFNGHSSRITVPYSGALSPGTADVTASVQVLTTHQPGTGDQDFDLIRASPTGKMYKIELFPHGSVKAQAQCIFIGSANRITVHAGPSLDDGRWHTIVCRKTSSRVTLTVDGNAVGSANITIGSITLKKGAVFALGYKPVPGGSDGDFYNGRMRSASVSIG
jgi:Concanavalin A-like lectin/glucanases superfamily